MRVVPIGRTAHHHRWRCDYDHGDDDRRRRVGPKGAQVVDSGTRRPLFLSWKHELLAFREWLQIPSVYGTDNSVYFLALFIHNQVQKSKKIWELCLWKAFQAFAHDVSDLPPRSRPFSRCLAIFHSRQGGEKKKRKTPSSFVFVCQHRKHLSSLSGRKKSSLLASRRGFFHSHQRYVFSGTGKVNSTMMMRMKTMPTVCLTA